MKNKLPLLTTALLASLTLPSSQCASADKGLKDYYQKDFYVGAALNYRQISGRDAKATALIKEQFNTISPENLLKWESVHPQPDTYNFRPADDYVAFGQQNKMFIIGHTLMWHQQTPKWVFEDATGKPASREMVLKRLEDHISTVVGRYKGKIAGWDVLNEAIDDQQGDLRKTKWLEIIGENFSAKAFEFAHKADPKAQLYYNDYSLYRPEKRAGVIKLVKSLQARGIKVAAIGMQGHYGLTKPSLAQVEASIVAFSKLGVHVNFTELDIDVLPTARGPTLPKRLGPTLNTTCTPPACPIRCSSSSPSATPTCSPCFTSTATLSTASRSGASPTPIPG